MVNHLLTKEGVNGYDNCQESWTRVALGTGVFKERYMNLEFWGLRTHGSWGRHVSKLDREIGSRFPIPLPPQLPEPE